MLGRGKQRPGNRPAPASASAAPPTLAELAAAEMLDEHTEDAVNAVLDTLASADLVLANAATPAAASAPIDFAALVEAERAAFQKENTEQYAAIQKEFNNKIPKEISEFEENSSIVTFKPLSQFMKKYKESPIKKIIFERMLSHIVLAKSVTIEMILYLREQGVDLNTKIGELQMPPLFYAILFKKKDVVNAFLKNADVQITTGSKKTALMMAAIQSDTTILELVLEELLIINNVDKQLNARDHSGKTPLMYAAKTGIVENCKLLVEMGAVVDAVDNNGETALIYAAKEGKDEVFEYLVSKSANMHHAGSNGMTAIMHAHFRKIVMIRKFKEEELYTEYNRALAAQNIDLLQKLAYKFLELNRTRSVEDTQLFEKYSSKGASLRIQYIDNRHERVKQFIQIAMNCIMNSRIFKDTGMQTNYEFHFKYPSLHRGELRKDVTLYRTTAANRETEDAAILQKYPIATPSPYMSPAEQTKRKEALLAEASRIEAALPAVTGGGTPRRRTSYRMHRKSRNHS